MRGATGGALLVLFALSSCGDDDGPSPAETDAGLTLDVGSSDVGIEPPDDAGQVNTCLAPELQHLPCCWESSNADRDVLQFAARGVSFVLPESFANEVFRTTVQEGLDAADGGELNFMLLVRATPMGSGYRAEIGYGCRSSREEPWRFGLNGLCGASDDRWAPVPVAATIVDDVLSTETAEAPLVVPLPAAGNPYPELRFHGARIAHATLTDGRSCIGARTPSRRWSYGERGSESEVGGYFDVEEARATTIMSLGGMSMCDLIARTACDQPRGEWLVRPDSRCDGEACVADACAPDSEDPVTGCNAWRISLRFAAAGVDIQ